MGEDNTGWFGIFQMLRSEWPTVTTAPHLFVLAAILGLICGVALAWRILKQRLAHHKEMIDHYEKAIERPNVVRPPHKYRLPSLENPFKAIFLAIELILPIPAIVITYPVKGTLEGGEPRGEKARVYSVRAKTRHLSSAHKIWVLTKNERGEVWPQEKAWWNSGRREWEGGVWLWNTQSSVTIVTVAAPPTSDDLFAYYHDVRKHYNEIIQRYEKIIEQNAEPLKHCEESIKQARQTQRILQLKRLPLECTIIDEVRARKKNS